MKKRCLLIALMIVFSAFSVGCADSGAQDGGVAKPPETPLSEFEYSVSEEHQVAAILKYIGSTTDVVVPRKIEGYPVTSIYTYAFVSTTVESVWLPDSVEKIWNGAFAGCTSLHTVVLGDSLKEIDTDAFRKCTALKNIELPTGLQTIGYRAFSECRSLEAITIPKTVMKMEMEAFCFTSLSSLVFEDGIEKIGSYACFWSLGDLKSVTIPASVKEIGEYTFEETLKEVHFLGDAPQKVGKDPFDENTVIYYNKNTDGWEDTELKQYSLVAEGNGVF